MINTSRNVRLSGLVFFLLVTLLLLRAILHDSSNEKRPNKFRVEEQVVVILVHPSPSLNKAANFELKRAIARTWAKDVEDLGASVFFVGEHDGETVMRRPSEFQGRAQALTSGSGSILAKEVIGAVGGQGDTGEPMRKMLIPSILENGQADDPSGYLKASLFFIFIFIFGLAYHFLYNNTNWFAGPIFQTYPFVLTTDTTHYIHVENLVMTLLSSRPRRLLTMKDDSSFSGPLSEASECSAEEFGDRGDDKSNPNNHWTLSRTHLVSKQMISMVGPHLRYCVRDTADSLMDSGEAFKKCVKTWTANPLFWKNGYCGRFSALRYQAPAPGTFSDSDSSPSFHNKIQRRSSPEDFTEFYHIKQQERELEQKGGYEAIADASDVSDINLLKPGAETLNRQRSRKILQQLTSSSPESPARWIVASGLTQPEDFALIYQGLSDKEEKEDLLEEEVY
ncbi:hypothetical protein BGZ46_009597 [Entomortierella lignicola]|nr:hypothetical protein BGZ46_009597 [Entomortierella lignicola]